MFQMQHSLVRIYNFTKRSLTICLYNEYRFKPGDTCLMLYNLQLKNFQAKTTAIFTERTTPSSEFFRHNIYKLNQNSMDMDVLTNHIRTIKACRRIKLYGDRIVPYVGVDTSLTGGGRGAGEGGARGFVLQ